MTTPSLIKIGELLRHINPIRRLLYWLAESSNDLRRKKTFFMKNYLMKVIFKSPKILDMGSSERFTFPLSIYSKESILLAIDFSPPKNHPYSIIASAINPPLKKDSFDLIIASELIEHVGDYVKDVVIEIKRLLKPKGIAIISTPYLWDILTSFDRLLLLEPIVKYYIKNNKIPKLNLLKNIVDFRKSQGKMGAIHTSYNLPNYWRKLFQIYFKNHVEIGVLIKPFGFSLNKNINWLLASDLIYLCSDSELNMPYTYIKYYGS